MGQDQPDRPRRTTETFIGGPNVGVSVPLRTLSDDFHDEPAEPEDSDRVPEPAPPSLVQRLFHRLRGSPDRH